MKEALQIAYNDDLPVDKIYIEPPEGALTDEDSGDEDGGGLIDNLSKNQLRATAELVVIAQDDSENNIEDIRVDATDLNSAVLAPTPLAQKIDLALSNWIQGDIEPGVKQFPLSYYENFKSLIPTELFELFFDDILISFLVTETERYAQQKNISELNVTSEEMKVFLAILIIVSQKVVRCLLKLI